MIKLENNKVRRFQRLVSASAPRKREAGYTLVEMTVVMAIIAVIMTLGAFGMQGAKRQVALQAAAKELQSNIRFASNSAITVSPAMGRSEISKAWLLKVPCGETKKESYFDIWSYYSDSMIYTSKRIEYPSDIKIYSDQCRKSMNGQYFDRINFIFSTPFARLTTIDSFEQYGLSCGNWGTNPETQEKLPCASYPSRIYSSGQVLNITVTDGTSSTVLKVNTTTGESSIN